MWNGYVLVIIKVKVIPLIFREIDKTVDAANCKQNNKLNVS